MGGYVCVPDMHDAESIKIKDSWVRSKNVHEMFLVTATFPRDVKQYLNETSKKLQYNKS